MTPSRDSRSADRDAQRPPLEATRSSGDLPDETALRAAVSASLAAGEGPELATVAEIEQLLEVVRRRGTGPLVLEPIATELVAAIVSVNYQGLNRSPEFWRIIAAKIAAVLYEAPAARARLENLWRRLVESYGAHA